MYFSSCIDAAQPTLSDDLIIPVVGGEMPDVLTLHRWENHMIMFTHDIDIS